MKQMFKVTLLVTILITFSSFVSGSTLNVLNYGAQGDGVTDDTQAINDCISDANPGDTIYFPGSASIVYKITGNIVVDKSLTLEGDVLSVSPWRSKIRQYTLGKSAIEVTTSNVTVKNLFLQGTGWSSTRTNNSNGIYAHGPSSSSYISNLTIDGCYIYYWQDNGIELEYVDEFSITSSRTWYITYAGIIAYSCDDGLIKLNNIRDIKCLLNQSEKHGYGVAITHLNGKPRSNRITVEHNTVRRVKEWEGLDTHGGTYIYFKNNHIYDCYVGIMLCNSDSGYAPAACKVLYNDIHYNLSAGTSHYGICVAGVPGGTKASGHVGYNKIYDYGQTNNRLSGGIRCRDTNGLRIYWNDIYDSISVGICMDNKNTNYAILHNDIDGIKDLSTLDRAFGINIYGANQPGEIKWNNITGEPKPWDGIRVYNSSTSTITYLDNYIEYKSEAINEL
jgi:nitrous oxidase accessory protein NosD